MRHTSPRGHHGLLPEKDVLEANADPYNLRTGVSRPHPLHFSGNRFELAIGNNVMTLEDVGSGAAMVPVLIDREPLMVIRIMDEHVLLSLALRDEANNVVCRVIDNELVYSTTPWDISFVGSTLTLRSARSQIRAELKFEPPERLTINRCRLLLNGVEVLVQPEYRPQLGGHPAPHRARGAPWPRHRANRDPHQERVPAYQQGGAQQEPDVGAWPVQEEQEGEKGRGGGFSVSDTPA